MPIGSLLFCSFLLREFIIVLKEKDSKILNQKLTAPEWLIWINYTSIVTEVD